MSIIMTKEKRPNYVNVFLYQYNCFTNALMQKVNVCNYA